MITYSLIESEEKNCEIGGYTAYGLEAQLASGTESTRIDSLSDISTDRSLVEGLVNYCNEKKVAPFSLMDVVDEWIG